ncbi:MAG: hypothetical protein J2P41_14595 [Blastocatellia bacterium]|nr:hypothetical protein [Blastocatellia bacterium]
MVPLAFLIGIYT